MAIGREDVLGRDLKKKQKKKLTQALALDLLGTKWKHQASETNALCFSYHLIYSFLLVHQGAFKGQDILMKAYAICQILNNFPLCFSLRIME